MQYDVVLVPFPFDDLTGAKVRPAVCLTDVVGTHRHVVLAFITSVVPTQLEPTDVVIDPSSAGFAATGLKVRSSLRLHRMVTVSSNIVLRKLGVLPAAMINQVQSKLRGLFKL